ncbi:chemotaxis-specific protein-glutamate methyltransferase CheB [Sphingomonas sp. PP-CE-3G-477]|uniref:chemotaxis-specific protein-glutamate methyltransferase CheB n=1 Tax=Sphingomonas sp. PP-CE-3G-477 TaxID=2135660 RepID=UPI002158CA6C|nr:chemotaxis-specific protein-glutamate methyltransferase CheB [Sphingomonas sp. PP-CE-3G-477]
MRPLPVSRYSDRDGLDTAQVLIVDDSVVARAVIARMIDASDRFSVVGAVGNVAAALEFLGRAMVDFILLDIQMPGVDGLTALPSLVAAGRGAKVLIVSSTADEGGAIAVQALALGAAETLIKPAAGALSGRFGSMLVAKLEKLSERPSPMPAAALVRPAPQSNVRSTRESDEAPTRQISSSADYDIVAIGASTGGIHALSQMFRALPAGFRLPIVITQHLPASFMPYFAAQIALLAGRPCEVAVDRLRIRPGRIIIAPGDAHLKCVKLSDGGAAFRLTHEPVASGCMPSVDPMLGSLADVYGARMLAIILSGMGRDGAEGARRVHEVGGCVVAQDQQSSVVWGMPGAVAAAGVADAVLPPDAIGRLVASRRRP